MRPRYIFFALLNTISPTSLEAFSLPKRGQVEAFALPNRGQVRVYSQSDDSPSTQDREDPNTTTGAGGSDTWIDRIDESMLNEIRQELVRKFEDEGVSRDDAEREVAVFFQDKDRAEKYLEMRMYAAAQADDLPNLVFQLLSGFFVGFLIVAGPKYLQAYQASHP